MTHDDLIQAAANILRPHVVKDRLFGDVGAALLSTTGDTYVGVSVDTAGWGFCAESSAMAAMITAGHYQIERIVAVWRDKQSGALHVLPPCGSCREFMRNVDPANMKAEIILGSKKSMKLEDLLPMHAWPAPYNNPEQHPVNPL